MLAQSGSLGGPPEVVGNTQTRDQAEESPQVEGEWSQVKSKKNKGKKP